MPRKHVKFSKDWYRQPNPAHEILGQSLHAPGHTEPDLCAEKPAPQHRRDDGELHTVPKRRNDKAGSDQATLLLDTGILGAKSVWV